MWGKIVTEATFETNFNTQFPNTKTDVLIHLAQWQYWWWFWFSFLWVLYYLFLARTLRYRTLKFRPKIVSSFRPHGKWGDVIICILPVSWCANILINSNFLLKLLEWQAESSLFTIRIRGKQWYWVYKFDFRNFSDIISTPKNIGNNKWMFSFFGDLKTSDNYLHIIQMRAQNKWIKKYWIKNLGKFEQEEKSNINLLQDFFKIDNFKKKDILLDRDTVSSEQETELAETIKNTIAYFNDILENKEDILENKEDILENKEDILDVCIESGDISIYRNPENSFVDVQHFDNELFNISSNIDDLSITCDELQDISLYLSTCNTVISVEAWNALFELKRNRLLKVRNDLITLYDETEDSLLVWHFDNELSLLEEDIYYDEPMKSFTEGFGKLAIATEVFSLYDYFDDAVPVAINFIPENFVTYGDKSNPSYTAEECIIDFILEWLTATAYSESFVTTSDSTKFRQDMLNFDKKVLDVVISSFLPNSALGDSFFLNSFKLLFPIKENFFIANAALIKNNFNFFLKDFQNMLKDFYYTSVLPFIPTNNNFSHTEYVYNVFSFQEESNRVAKSLFGKPAPLSLIKLPVAHVDSTGTKLFKFRYTDQTTKATSRNVIKVPYFVFKQVRYKRRKSAFATAHIFYDSLGNEKSIKKNFSLNNQYSIEQDVKNPTRYYRMFKKNRVRSENMPVVVAKRLLRVKRTLVIPTHINITAITNSYDVVHSWFIPGLGLKMDCVPGRSTHHTFYVDNAGFYYGQCAEICGRYHHHMPIRVCALPFEHFLIWWQSIGLPKLLYPNKKYNMLKSHSFRKFVW